MVKRLAVLMAALMVLGFVVTGCGSDDNGSDNSDTAAQTVTDVDTVTEDETVTDTETVTDETDTDVTSDNGGAAVSQAVESCKQGIDNAQGLSDDTKDSLQEICEKAGSGDPEQIQDATVEVCKKLAGELPEIARDQALASCDQAGK